MTDYVVATIKSWNIRLFDEALGRLPGNWHLLTRPEDLTLEALGRIAPRYVFFPHWSWLVPPTITNDIECVCFHMTDLPYGRGGSPLQNLIIRGHERTMISALRMTAEMDAGPIYMKRPLSLSGSAREILERAARTIFDMIAEIVSDQPSPVPQVGAPVIFTRRRPAESALPPSAAKNQIYDHIRMLDAEGYPPAFVDHGSFRLEFSDARLDGKELTARVRFVSRGDDEQ